MERKIKKGQYALCIKSGSVSSYIEFKDLNGKSLGHRLPLSFLDSITMKSKNELTLVCDLIDEGALNKPSLKKSLKVFVSSLKKEDIKDGLNISEVAYSKHSLLSEFVNSGEKEVKKGKWTSAFISAVLFDVSRNGLCWREFYEAKNKYNFSGLIDLITKYQNYRSYDLTPSEAAEIYECKSITETKINNYLYQDYKRLRDVYFFSKSVQAKYPDTKLQVTEVENNYKESKSQIEPLKNNPHCEQDIIDKINNPHCEQDIIDKINNPHCEQDIIDKINNPDRNPFYHYDPFDRNYDEQPYDPDEFSRGRK